MCNINLSKLSPNLYQEAVKAAKEGNIKDKIDSLVNIASEKGFTVEEKSFLEGLASDTNVERLKAVKSPLETVDFIDPGFNFTKKPAEDSKEIPVSRLDAIKSAFNDFAVQPLKDMEKGVFENKNQMLIRSKISSVEAIGNETLDKLSSKVTNPTDRANFITLFKGLDSKSKEELKAIVNSKDGISLTAKDTKGVTVIDNLVNLNNVTRNKLTGEKVDGKALTKQAISMLKDDKNILQGQHGTCGAGTLENYMREKAPSELIRIVKELASDGKSTLGDKDQRDGLNLPKGSLNYSESGRNQFDRIFQSAVMQRVAVIGGDERSMMFLDVSENKVADYDVKNDDGSPEAVKGGDSAADPYLLTNLMNRMMKGKDKFETRSNYNVGNLFGKDVALSAMKESLAKGNSSLACFKYDGSMTGSRHYVLVNSIAYDPTDKKTYVHFKNTASPSENKMELSEFAEKLEFTINSKK